MAVGSNIEWTDATWNPVRGCTKVSPGCKHCYAETFAERFRGVPGHPFEQGFDLRLIEKALELPLHWRAPRRIFVNSMSDLFHEDVPAEFIGRVFDVMARAPQHEFQVLTKRSARMAELTASMMLPPNVWMGVSIESSDYVSRVDDLRRVNAVVRFLSIEPLLGPIASLELAGIHWVIVGGESGPGARRLDPEWVRVIRAECHRAQVPFFFKQWGGVRKHVTGRVLDGRTWDEMPRTDRALRIVPALWRGDLVAPKSVTWPLDPHTRAKHEILRRYLHAWTPILTLGGFPTVAYVDGFAGPGVYKGGEDGSPVIALKAALAHRARIKGTILFLFIESTPKRAARLQEIVDKLDRPDNFHVHVAAGQTFEEGIRVNLLDHYRSKKKALPPTFAFIDPFGWTGVPFDLVKEILAQPSCEVLINFMYEDINRFIDHPDQEANFDRLFGTEDWRQMSSISGRKARNEFLHGLYHRQLRSVAKYVRSFEMRNDNDVTDYFLFFATSNLTGLKKMKEAMWKVDQTGEFRFSDATDPAQTLLFGAPDFGALRRAIVERFAGRVASVRDVEEFVLAETPFRETHYKTNVLRVLEREGKFHPVAPPAGRKPGTYGKSTMKLRFEL